MLAFYFTPLSLTAGAITVLAWSGLSPSLTLAIGASTLIVLAIALLRAVQQRRSIALEQELDPLPSVGSGFPAGAIAESEKRFRFLAEAIPQQVWTATPDGKLDYVNQRVLDYFDQPLEQVMGWNWQALLHPEDLPRCLEQWQQSINTGQPYEVEFRLQQGRTATYRWHIARALPFYNAEGQNISWFGTNTDIDDQKRAAEELRLRDRAIAASSSGIVISDFTQPDHPLIYVNPSFERITGYSAAEVLGRNCRFLQQQDQDQPELLKLRTAIHQGQECTVILRNYRKDGSLFWNELNISPIYDEQGCLTNFIGVQTDITERIVSQTELVKALEKEKELRELKSRFISMASHEFRTPLATILAASDVLKHHGHKLSHQKRLERLDKIQAEVHHMTHLLEDVLVISKTEAGRMQLTLTPLNLEEFCQDLLEEVELTARATHTFELRIQGENTWAELDEKLLRQILTNLLSNAVKYSPEGGLIRFALMCEEEYVMFRVEDQGIGIPGTDQKHLFAAFHRAANVGSIPGTGLGLAILKNAVDLQGGSVTIDSTVGKGTTVTVCIPKVQRKEPST